MVVTPVVNSETLQIWSEHRFAVSLTKQFIYQQLVNSRLHSCILSDLPELVLRVGRKSRFSTAFKIGIPAHLLAIDNIDDKVKGSRPSRQIWNEGRQIVSFMETFVHPFSLKDVANPVFA
jgi:hypothetical protein